MLKEKSSALKFLENFEKGLKEINKEDLYGSYSHSKKWTTKIEGIYKYIEKNMFESSDIVRLYSKDQNCNICKEYEICKCTKKYNKGEYMSIDATYWSEGEKISNNLLEKTRIKGNENVWNPLVAVEHENDSASSIYELKQLLFNNVPLRVLITYADAIASKDLEEGSSSDDYNIFKCSYKKIFEISEKKMKMKDGDEFLLIFGCKKENFVDNKTIVYISMIATKKADRLIWCDPQKIIIPLDESFRD